MTVAGEGGNSEKYLKRNGAGRKFSSLNSTLIKRSINKIHSTDGTARSHDVLKLLEQKQDIEEDKAPD